MRRVQQHGLFWGYDPRLLVLGALARFGLLSVSATSDAAMASGALTAVDVTTQAWRELEAQSACSSLPTMRNFPQTRRLAPYGASEPPLYGQRELSSASVSRGVDRELVQEAHLELPQSRARPRSHHGQPRAGPRFGARRRAAAARQASAGRPSSAPARPHGPGYASRHHLHESCRERP